MEAKDFMMFIIFGTLFGFVRKLGIFVDLCYLHKKAFKMMTVSAIRSHTDDFIRLARECVLHNAIRRFILFPSCGGRESVTVLLHEQQT